MNKYDCECKYCGERWVSNFAPYIKQKCSKCQDKNIIVRKIETIDYYADKVEVKEKIREHED